jgi:hypothetical protein
MNRVFAACLFASIFFGLAPTPSQAQEITEPTPYLSSFVIRGLAGLAVHQRHSPVIETSSAGAFGAELNFKLIRLEQPGAGAGGLEFSDIGIGFHFDRYSYVSTEYNDSISNFLGQIVFFHHDTWGAYFAPEFGIRKVESSLGQSAGQGFVAGIMGGVEVPLTQHFSYGPQIHFDYNLPMDVSTGTGITGIDTGLQIKAFLSVNAHF